jgi:hypothetical protein
VRFLNMAAALQALQRHTRKPQTPMRALACAACRHVLRESRGVGAADDAAQAAVSDDVPRVDGLHTPPTYNSITNVMW